MSGAALELAKAVQASKLRLEPQRVRRAELAFGAGVLGRLGPSELVILNTGDYGVRKRLPLVGPRAVIALADGALLAVGAEALLRFEPRNGRVQQLARPMLLPDAELLADAVRADHVWVFDPGVSGQQQASPSALISFELRPADGLVPLPTGTLELEAGAGVLGATREGVWIHWGEGRAERFGPGGARLRPLKVPDAIRPIWALPARRLDQCYLFDREGRLSKAVVSPTFRELASIKLSGIPWTADVGDEGRLVAVLVVIDAGPRFELQLFDSDLKQLARVPVISEAPTGGEDWVKVVTENQGLRVAPREPRVAVGGPARLQIFDARGAQVFSSSSQ